MSEVIKTATRDAYGKALVELGNTDAKILVLDADLAAATKTGMFKKEHPEKFIDCGIAEGNMMGVAAGLATCGKTVFASSFAMFASGRAYEQIRNSIGYPHLNVKIGASHAGISVGEDGATHQCNEDFAIMRSIPGMVVICPSDDVEACAAVRAAAEYDGPVYLRLGRLAVPVFNDPANYKFEMGKGVVMKEGTDVSIFATGLEVNEALGAAKLLEADGINAEVINIHTIKPIDKELVAASAKKTGKVRVILNFPQNPSGYSPTKDEAQQICKVVKEVAESGAKILVCCDDAYFGLNYEENIETQSLFAYLADIHENVLAVKIDGPTKEDYVWGMRCGFLTFGCKGFTAEQYDALVKKLMGDSFLSFMLCNSITINYAQSFRRSKP